MSTAKTFDFADTSEAAAVTRSRAGSIAIGFWDVVRALGDGIAASHTYGAEKAKGRSTAEALEITQSRHFR